MIKARALVTLLSDAPSKAFWTQYCRANWAQYAARHDADLIVLEELPDPTPYAQIRPLSWQKYLAPSLPFALEYDRLVCLDADILIHPHAPWIGENVPPHRVGAVDEYAAPTPELYQRALTKLDRIPDQSGVPFRRNLTAHEFYVQHGMTETFPGVVQTGAMVLSPREHRQIFARIYGTLVDSGARSANDELCTASYELLRAHAVHWLDPKFNALWRIDRTLHYPFLRTENNHPLHARCVTDALRRNYFLRFAGEHDSLAQADLDAAELNAAPRPRLYAAPSQTPPRCGTPVALFLFNRPDTTAQVLNAIRTVRPRALYLIADGPRREHPDDGTLCAAARQAALAVDWDCKVNTHFADSNLGLKRRVESGLDWLFMHEPEAILLEDDCVPDATFFRFASELLEKYREDARIMAISGCDYTFGLGARDADYRFSRYPLIWGWATWRRAWALHDPAMQTLPGALAANRLMEKLGDARAAQYWAYLLNDNYQTHTTWDYAWQWSIWEHDGLCIHPTRNLVKNIGFGAQATHTQNNLDPFADFMITPMQFPLAAPDEIVRDAAGDAFIEEITFSGTLRQLWKRVRTRRRAHAAEVRP